MRRSSKNRFDYKMYLAMGWVYVLRALILPVGILALIQALLSGDTFYYYIALAVMIAFGVLSFIFWSACDRVVCRLCRAPFLKHLSCVRKRGKIPHVLGDRSLATALSIITMQKSITCQYCTEKQVYFDRRR